MNTENPTEIKVLSQKMMDIFQTYNHMESNNVVLSFKGDITTELMSSVLQIIEIKLEKVKEDPKIKKRVFNVLVECLQNLYHHIDEVKSENNGELPNKSVIVMVSMNPKFYSITTGNYMYSGKVQKLRERLEKINAMSESALKDYYIDTLNNQQISEKGGGGLGIIDIARKTGNPLKYDFREINKEYTFFSLEISINHN